MKLQIGSLFSGIGGLELGLERTKGFATRWQVEIDPFCRKVLRKHWPLVPRTKDVTTFPQGPVKDWYCDILTGGFPCQPVSTAGQRKGEDDKRWLWKEMLRVCSILRPRWVLAENVRGLLSAASGTLFGTILSDLADLGYCVEWSLLSACSVGASHTRERLFVVAYPDGHGLEGMFGQLEKKHDGQEGEASCFIPQSSNAPKRWTGIELPSPVFCRSADGISSKVDRTRCLGNAVVPQAAYWIGKRILEADKWLKRTSGANGSPNTKST